MVIFGRIQVENVGLYSVVIISCVHRVGRQPQTGRHKAARQDPYDIPTTLTT